MIDVASDDLYSATRMPSWRPSCSTRPPRRQGPVGRTLRALYNARNVMDGKFRSDPVNRATFRKILMQPTAHPCDAADEPDLGAGALPVGVPRIVGQMQHDLFHVYTVDQHILMVLRNVRRFFIAEHAHEYPFCSQLAAGWDKPYILYVAALFHDIAKGRGRRPLRAGRHRRAPCSAGSTASTREDARMIEFLVREHLSMSRIAQKADLSDPDVIRAFAAKVGNERYLTALYLLTVADIRGTSPKVWNAWKGKLLEDLYRLTCARWAAAPDPDAEVEARKREALVMIALYALPFEAHKPLWDTLDVGYFMRHDAADIAWHTRHLSRHVGADKPVVRARRSPVGEGLQVLVYTPRPARPVRPHLRLLRPWPASASWMPGAHRAQRLCAGHLPGRHPAMPEHYRELTSMVENGLAAPSPTPAAARAQPWAGVAPGQELSDCAARHAAARRKRPALAAQHLRQRPRRPAVQRWHGCWRGTTSTCNWPRSPRWASGWTTPS
jgi:[protein-PII] uridylyltransferase